VETKDEEIRNVASDISIPQTLTDLDLVATEFPPPHFLVADLIPEGVTILAGKPKTGKSLLAQNLGLAVAGGTKALGSVDVSPHEVLYLALEDTGRRMKARLAMMNGSNAPTNKIYFAFQWPRIDRGGMKQLENWLINHPETKLIIIDTLGKIRSLSGSGYTPYDRDYHDVSSFKKIADQYSVAIILVHHLRKASAEDCLDLVTGTTGLVGAADTVAILKRQRMNSDASLLISGRDIEEKDLALHFDSTSYSWTIVGQADEYRLSKERQDIVDVLKSADRPLKLSEIAMVLGKKAPVIHKHLAGLIATWFVEQPKYGHYKLHDSSDGQSV